MAASPTAPRHDEVTRCGQCPPQTQIPSPSTLPPPLRHCEEPRDAAVHSEPFRTDNPIHALLDFTRWVQSGWPRRMAPRSDEREAANPP
jgi:hypothetical protein